MDPDMSAGFDYGQVISRVIHEPFLINSYCHDFKKVDGGRKMSGQLWIHMPGYPKYISSGYLFILSFVQLLTGYRRVWRKMCSERLNWIELRI